MTPTRETVRRGLFAAFAVCAAGGAAIAAVTVPSQPSATAAPDPCAASTVAKTVGSVATSTGYYLDSHPETNTALTMISQQQGGPQSLAALKAYFDANPQVAKDMQQLQRPLTDLSGRCKLPVTVPQILGVLQGAQQGGGVPTDLPGSLPGAQTVGVPGSALPAQSSPASAVVEGTGPLPGPAVPRTR
ncbi:hemophore [Mycolicibacterium agri]|uniref:Hemophore n=1 Tax=Mycolicibacterium agri TaxID=36811 RepID=A0A2A7N4D6_MYCAG|nr:hemophore [Mycolicibacterium agri]PEG38895.1 hemophore [Mycolicibacterium agri]GFG53183.1 hemophore [Mycolicibacterium agri]